MYAYAVYNGIGTGEIHIFKYAHMRRSAAVSSVRTNTVTVDDYKLAGVNLTDELCTYAVECAAFGRYEPAAVCCSAEAKRTEAVGISCCDELCRGHNEDRVCTSQFAHCVGNGYLDRRAAQSFLGNCVRDDLCIVSGVENRTSHFVGFTEFPCVYKISVMCKSHRAFNMAHNERLCIASVGAARGGIADMTDSGCSAAERFKYILCKNITDKSEVFMITENAVVIQNYSAGLLTSVLECVQTHIGLHCSVRTVRCINAENAALLMNTIKHRKSFLSVPAVCAELAAVKSDRLYRSVK